MKAVMQSIKPKWANLIFRKVKTNELRKTKPSNIEYPFKVYMYETKLGAGAVVGEYICNGITTSSLALTVGTGSCVSDEDIQKYMGKGKICGWSVADVNKYDQPKPLSDFGLERAPQSWCYVEG